MTDTQALRPDRAGYAMTDQRDTRIAELETLLARNLVFDRGSADDALEALGGWGRMVELVEAHHARHTQEAADK